MLLQDGSSTPYPPASSGRRPLRIPTTIQNAFAWLKRQLPNLDPKDLLPLGIEVTTGALILGNPSTPHLLVAEFHSAEGTFGVLAVRLWLFCHIGEKANAICSLAQSTTCTSRT
jgi:hypothetical protein